VQKARRLHQSFIKYYIEAGIERSLAPELNPNRSAKTTKPATFFTNAIEKIMTEQVIVNATMTLNTPKE
jgi:hypothetical protein